MGNLLEANTNAEVLNLEPAMHLRTHGRIAVQSSTTLRSKASDQPLRWGTLSMHVVSADVSNSHWLTPQTRNEFRNMPQHILRLAILEAILGLCVASLGVVPGDARCLK